MGKLVMEVGEMVDLADQVAMAVLELRAAVAAAAAAGFLVMAQDIVEEKVF